MKCKKYLLNSILPAILVVLYILGVATLMLRTEDFEPKQPVIGIAMFLLLFVLSAATVGSLIFGRPIMLFLEGEKKQALKYLGGTILSLLIILIIFAITISLL